MGYVKVVKNKAYFKRFAPKFRRRREGKTDYRARKRLVAQQKNKYNSAKYRFVVRFTNKIVICQIIYSEMTSDVVICSAYSSELKRYGLTVGLKNYSAAYCTGLLCARRLLAKMGLDQMYQGNEADGKVYTTKYAKRTLYVDDLDWESERRPFRCALDCGNLTTTTGARIFGALKGAVDGGLDVPHSNKRFPGYDREKKSYDPEDHRDRIFGQHVSGYIEELQDNGNDERVGKVFKCYMDANIEPDAFEEMYEKVHAAIRANPGFVAGKEYVKKKEYHEKKRSYKQRKGRIAQKKAWKAWKEENEADDDDEEEEEEEQ